MAMIINEATGSNLSSQLRNHLWQPLRLTDFYLSQEETIPPDQQAHVYGDNWDGPIRDVTFLPRTSHESITYGSSGIFTTSENLARWSQALFEGEVLEAESMDEMLDFVTFKPVSNMRGYGLGVEEFVRQIASGQRAIGHGGGNIGTTTYMVYLPEQQVSVVVMINAFPNEGADEITRGLIRVVLSDLGAFEIIPYLLANWLYLIIAASAIVFVTNVIYQLLRRKRTQNSDPKNSKK